MSSPTLPQRRVLVIGPKLAAIASEAMPGCDIEVAAAETVDAASLLRGGADLVLIDAAAGDAARLTTVIGALAQIAAPPAAILVGGNLPAALARALFRLKRSDVLDAPVSAAELARCVAGLFADQSPAGESVHRSQCWSVIGAVGGAGATTLAIEMATTLAGRTLGDRVGLFDLNLADGAASAYLGATPNMHLADASIAPDRIDAAMLDSFSVRVAGGVDLFACPRDGDAFQKVTPAAVCRLLEVACSVYDWLIIDLPRHRHAWTSDVIAGSDELLVISELTVPALLAARALTGELEAEMEEHHRARIVLNRMASRVFGPAPSRAEAERALGRKVAGVISSDWEAAACSANLGGSISQHRPRSKIVKDVVGMVEDMVGQPASRKVA